MNVDKMKLCTRVVAPKHTINTDVMTFKTSPTPDVEEWFLQNKIWDSELLAEDDGDHGPLFVYYFAKEQDAILFSLRWS